MNCIQKMFSGLKSQADDPNELIASLILAAKEDAEFRRLVLLVLDSPSQNRKSITDRIIQQMTLNRESESIRAAFAVLSTDIGARAVSRILTEK